MKTKLQFLKTDYRYALSSILLLIFMGFGNHIKAQQSLLTLNSKTNWVLPTFNGLTAVATTNGIGSSAWTNANNLIDNNITNGATLALSNGLSSTNSANGLVTISNTQTYDSGNLISIDFNVVSTSLLLPSTALTYELETSLDGITYTVVNNQMVNNDEERSVFGYAAGSYKFIRLKIILGVGSLRSANISFKKISMTKLGLTTSSICNTNANFVKPNFAAKLIDSRSKQIAGIGLTIPLPYLNLDRVIDADTTNFGQLGVGIGLNVAAKFAVSVQDTLKVYPANTYMGYKVSVNSIISLGLFNGFEIVTYLNGIEQERKSGNSMLLNVGLLASGTPFEMGIITTKVADEVQVVYNAELVSLGAINIYHPIIKSFCEGTVLQCNMKNYITSPAYPISIDKQNSGLVSVGLGDNVMDLQNIIDADTNNYASINQSLASLGSALQIVVKKELLPFSGGNFAGFNIGNDGLLGLDVLNSIVVETYNDGVLKESSANSGTQLLAVGASILNGSGRKTIGIKTTQDFDEVRLKFNTTLAINVLTSMKIYGFVVQEFCLGSTLSCNQSSVLSNPLHPVYIDGKFTGFNGIANIANSINNTEAIIDNDTSNFASIDLTVGIGTSASIAITNALQTYDSGSYIAFDIATTSVVDLNLLNTMKIRLIKNGVLLSTVYNPKMLAGVNVLGSESRYTIGVIANESFDGVQLVTNAVASVNLFGTLKVYGVSINKLCAIPLTCTTSIPLVEGMAPVIINNDRTGAGGIANVTLLGTNISDVKNILSADTSKFAMINNTVGALNATSISVLNPVQTYPKGTFAGYTIQNSGTGIIDLNLLQSIIINTYNNGVLQETKTANNLLELNLLVNLIGSGSSARNIGFITSQPFDEVQITVGELISLATNLKVYGAFVDLRTAVGGSLVCFNTSPDFAVTYKNKLVTGNVGTNDMVPVGTTYSNIIANPNNPNTSLPTLLPNGTYSFNPSIAGVYNFNYSVCLADQTTNCKVETIKFTVVDPTRLDNQPAINHEVVFVNGHDSVSKSATFHNLNDKATNGNGKLGVMNLIATPSLGTAIVNSNGTITYNTIPNIYGSDLISYSIEDTVAHKIDTAMVKIEILNADKRDLVVAVDDYLQTIYGAPITVSAANGVLQNDNNLTATSLSVVPKIDSIIGVGKIEFFSDGSYTFTPTGNYTGPAHFVYESNSSMPGANTSRGTLQILVQSAPDITGFQIFNSNVITINNEIVYTIGISNLGNSITSDIVEAKLIIPDPLTGLTLNLNTGTTFSLFGSVEPLNNDLFNISILNGMYIIKTKPEVYLAPNQTYYVGFKVNRNGGVIGQINSTLTITPNTGGGEKPTNNNSVSNTINNQ